jgi:hypothetical protein
MCCMDLIQLQPSTYQVYVSLSFRQTPSNHWPDPVLLFLTNGLMSSQQHLRKKICILGLFEFTLVKTTKLNLLNNIWNRGVWLGFYSILRVWVLMDFFTTLLFTHKNVNYKQGLTTDLRMSVLTCFWHIYILLRFLQTFADFYHKRHKILYLLWSKKLTGFVKKRLDVLNKLKLLLKSFWKHIKNNNLVTTMNIIEVS